MDISYGKDSSFKIKTKSASLVIEPSGKIVISDVVNAISDKIISGAGEYEIKGISILGYQVGSSTVYVIEADKINIGYLGHLEKDLTTEVVDSLGSIDILITDRATAVSDIEPYFTIPMYEDTVEPFIKETGLPSETMPKFLIKKEEIMEDQNTKVIVLERK